MIRMDTFQVAHRGDEEVDHQHNEQVRDTCKDVGVNVLVTREA
jgi:hypothetical protein